MIKIYHTLIICQKYLLDNRMICGLFLKSSAINFKCPRLQQNHNLKLDH